MCRPVIPGIGRSRIDEKRERLTPCPSGISHCRPRPCDGAALLCSGTYHIVPLYHVAGRCHPRPARPVTLGNSQPGDPSHARAWSAGAPGDHRGRLFQNVPRRRHPYPEPINTNRYYEGRVISRVIKGLFLIRRFGRKCLCFSTLIKWHPLGELNPSSISGVSGSTIQRFCWCFYK